MRAANLTRAQASQRSGRLQTSRYAIDLDLTTSDVHFASATEIVLTVDGEGAFSTFLDLMAESVDEVRVDGERVEVGEYDGARVPLTLTPGEHVVTVRATCRHSRTGQGLHRFVDPADGCVYLYTQFEVADARRVFACFDQPDLKATFALTVAAPADWTVISNSAHVEPEPAADGAAVWRFAPTAVMSTYLVALVAGHYTVVRDELTSASGEVVPLGLACRRSLVDHLDTERIWETTRRGFEVFEEHFGFPYPFGSYDQCFVPEYNMGAMENAGCVTFRDELIFRSRATQVEYEQRDNTILHELAHMWFGDLVTMRWWDDLWLNESFAEWASHFAQSEIERSDHAWAGFCNHRKNWAYRQDQLPSTHPIAADMVDLDAVENNFDGITYAKGASALRQLVAFVGREEFLAGVRDYFAEHAWGNTTFDDLLAALTTSSGRDLSGWAGQWLQVPGVNTVRAEFTLDDAGRYASLAVAQSAPPQWPTLRDHRMAIGCYDLVDGVLTRTRRVELDVRGERTEVADLVGVEQPDLLLLNDDDLTYAKVRLDERSLATVVSSIAAFDAELPRALCWSAAWDMTRDAEMAPADFVDLVLSGVASETDQAGVRAILANALTAATRFARPDATAALTTRLADGLLALVRSAEAGSDLQLQAARAFASAATTPAHAEVLRAWLAGDDVPAGLAVDQQVRWLLLAGLARLDAIDDAAITAETEADPSITGAEAAAAARAARPSVAAKAAAWEYAAETPVVANETHRKVCTAFHQPGQRAVLEPFFGRYRELAEAMASHGGAWADRSATEQHSALALLFPRFDVTAADLDAMRTWLDGAPLTEGIRRPVVEALDDAERALCCAEADAARG